MVHFILFEAEMTITEEFRYCVNIATSFNLLFCEYYGVKFRYNSNTDMHHMVYIYVHENFIGRHVSRKYLFQPIRRNWLVSTIFNEDSPVQELFQ